MATSSSIAHLQKRLLFKLPLDKNCTIHLAPSPATESLPSSLCCLTSSGDLFYAPVAGRQLKLLRHNVADVLWMDGRRLVLLDGSTHELLFYMVETQDAGQGVKFVVLMQFGFQFVANALLEHGLSLQLDDALQLVKFHIFPNQLEGARPQESLKELFCVAKNEHLLRFHVETSSRILQLASCLRLGRCGVAAASADLCLFFGPVARKLFITSTLEREFLVVASLRKFISTRTSAKIHAMAISPDVKWIILVTSDLDVHQIHFAALAEESVMTKCAVFSCQSGRYLEEDGHPPDVSGRRPSRRVNSLWEREVSQLVARNNAKENFTPAGWIFGPLDPGPVHMPWRAPEEFEGFVPQTVHCTTTETYVLAKNFEHILLLGVKKHAESDGIWLSFPQECAVAFPPTTSYPVLLVYPMSVAVIAPDAVIGFRAEVARAAAPDPWEDLQEGQVMELAFMQDIVDKAVDYLAKRYPNRSDILEAGYPTAAAVAIAREYLEARNPSGAQDILNFVNLDMAGEMRKLLYVTENPELRHWLLEELRKRDVLSDMDQILYDFVLLYEAHLPHPVALEAVKDWTELQRRHNLLMVAVTTKDVALVDTFPADLLFDLLLSLEDVPRLVAWIRSEPDFTSHPMQPAFRERVTGDDIANEFARCGIFSQSELGNWREYVLRLMSAFGTEHPFFDKDNPQRLLELPKNIRQELLDFCVESKLVGVMGELAEEAGLREWLAERQDSVPEWLAVYLLFRTTEMENVGAVKTLAEANARLCFGPDATLQRLIELEETELAVGLLFLSRDVGPWSGASGDALSPATLEQLQKQLSKHPKLQAALFPVRLTSAERLARSVTVYHLLDARAPFDPKKLFGWQSTNSLNSHYRTVELPSFSQPDLQEKYGYKKELDYCYYLKNCRPSFAYWSFVSQLTNDNFKEEMQAGRDMAFFLSVFFFMDDKIVAACVAFMEMLGIESLSTRITVQTARLIKNYHHKVSKMADNQLDASIRDTFIELYKYGPELAASVLADLLPATHHHLASRGLAPASWAAVPHWTLVNQFCDLYSLPLSIEFLLQCAGNNDWLGFVTFAELFQYPLATVVGLVEGFTQPHVRENVRLVLGGMKSGKEAPVQGGLRNVRGALYARIGVATSERTTSGTSTTSEDEGHRAGDGATGKSSWEHRATNLIDVLGIVHKALHPWRELLVCAAELHAPVYALLAANEPGVSRLHCLCVLLMTSFSEAGLLQARQALNITGPLLDHHWSRDHLPTLIGLHAAQQTLRVASSACRAVYPTAPLSLFLDVCADMDERQDRALLQHKLQKLSQLAARKASDVEDTEWGVGVGLRVLGRVVEAIKYENEWEWRKVLGVLRESGVMRRWEGGEGEEAERVGRLAAEVEGLSQTVQTDAFKILELKSLLRDFERSSIWQKESFRSEIWRGIFARLPVELVEQQSTAEILDILERALLASDALEEQCVLLTMLWQLEDTPARLRAAWEAKVTFGLGTPKPLAEWMADPLLGAGSPRGDLQTEILTLAGMSLSDIPPLVNKGNSRDDMLDAMTSHLLKVGHLVLAARVCTAFAFLNRDLDAVCAAIELAQRHITVDALPAWIVQQASSNTRRISATVLHNGATVDDEIVQWLRNIAAVCTLGRDVVQALLDLYMLSQLLGVGLEEPLRATTPQVLDLVFAAPTPDKLGLLRRCLVSFRADPLQVTACIAQHVRRLLIEGLQAPDVDVRRLGETIKPFLSVAVDGVGLGNHLVDAAGSVQTSSPPLAVELLIAGHAVLSSAGTLEGVARLMKACRGVAKQLAESRQWGALLRLLNGIGRYAEMTFVFQLIKEADEMERLFGRGVDKDPALRNALLNFLRQHHPDDHNAFDMLAAHYSMHREIAETFQAIAHDKLQVFKHRAIVDSVEAQGELRKTIQLLMDAAGNFGRAECWARQERCVEQARLLALQLLFLPTGMRLLSLNSPAGFVATHPRFAEAYIYAQAYGVTEEWADALYGNYVVKGDVRYLQDFSIKFPVGVGLVVDIAHKYKADPAKPPTAGIYMKKLVRLLSDVEMQYKLANDLQLNDLAMEILQIDNGAFLRDVMKF